VDGGLDQVSGGIGGSSASERITSAAATSSIESLRPLQLAASFIVAIVPRCPACSAEAGPAALEWAHGPLSPAAAMHPDGGVDCAALALISNSAGTASVSGAIFKYEPKDKTDAHRPRVTGR